MEDRQEYMDRQAAAGVYSAELLAAVERRPFGPLVVVNPTLKAVGQEGGAFFEGCLSVRGYTVGGWPRQSACLGNEGREGVVGRFLPYKGISGQREWVVLGCRMRVSGRGAPSWAGGAAAVGGEAAGPGTRQPHMHTHLLSQAAVCFPFTLLLLLPRPCRRLCGGTGRWTWRGWTWRGCRCGCG